MADDWERWERESAEMFGLDQTLTSGNKFFDPGDATHRGRSTPFPLLVDAKYTTRSSYSLKLKFLRDMTHRAAEQGKRFLLPLRFHVKGTTEDFVVLRAHDFAELLDRVNS